MLGIHCCSGEQPKKQIFGSLFPKTWGHSTAHREPQQLVVRNADAVSSP